MTAAEISKLINSPNFYDRYDETKKWDYVGVMAGRAMQSAEFNEMQHVLEDKIKSLGKALYADGTIIEGCAISYDTESKIAKLEAGRVFLDGLVYKVEAATLNIPDIDAVQAGIWKMSRCVTEYEDNSLFDPAKGTPQYHMPGAYRIVTEAVWGLSTDGYDMPFFPVYGVSDGEMVTQLQEAVSPEYTDALARYDNHANGDYVVDGLRVTALESDAAGKQVFSVSEGTAHVNGYEAVISHSVRVMADEEPNLADVKSEVHVFNADTNGTVTISVSHRPIENLKQVLITKERTVTLTHGGYTGCVDELPNTSTFEIVDVYQGNLHFTQNTDFYFGNDKLNWSLSGEEPAPYSSYIVTYRYRLAVNADAWDTDTVTISGGVANSLIEIDYDYRMPRIDLIVMYKDRSVGIVRGVAHRYSPTVPTTPPGAICLAEVYQNWDGLPEVKNVATQRVPVEDLRKMQERIQDLYSLVARNEQRFDIMLEAPTSAYNIFVDPLFDDDMRDAGFEQTALIARQALQLPFSMTTLEVNLNSEQTLDFTHEILLNQSQHTKSMQINPYQNFDPIPANVILEPSVDRYSQEVIETFNDALVDTHPGITWWYSGLISTQTSEKVEYYNLRQIPVKVTASGFGPNEGVTVYFDSIQVNCSSNSADSGGNFTGTFTIPANIPSGTKLVELIGSVETKAYAYFSGFNRKITKTINNLYRTKGDPLAQSFTLNESRLLSGVEFWLENKGASNIRVEIREMDNGYPTTSVLASAVLPLNTLTSKSWNLAEFATPVYLTAGIEYAVTILTNTSDHTVGIAELGDWDANTGWVRSQVYSEGVLFSSSNAVTWTPHQNADLAFRLLGAKFNNSKKIIELGSYDLTGVTDIMPLAEAAMTGSDTYVTFILKQGDVEITRMQPWQAISFDKTLSGEYILEAELSGDAKFSPILGRSPQLMTAKLANSANYISRAFACGANKRVMITTNEFMPHGSNIAISVMTGNDTWTEAEVSENTEIGSGWVTRKRFVNCNAGTTRIKIDLQGSASARPLLTSLSAVVLDA